MKYLLAGALLSAASVFGQQPPVPPASQNPSPMVENTRVHGRVEQRALDGSAGTFAGPGGKEIQVYVPKATDADKPVALLVHFLGAPFIAEQAVDALGHNFIACNVSIGAGSGIYDRSFTNPAAFDTLLAHVRQTASELTHASIRIGSITLSGFSAGHGAIRAILRDSVHYDMVGSILLLDGMHTSYVPEGVTMDKGSSLDTMNLVQFRRFARDAVEGRKRFLVTHSEIFPGTFASTTETADYLIHELGLKRTPILEWGPGGMQQLSEVRAGNFEIRGFAGNTASDHIDQFHGTLEFLKALLQP